MRTKNRLFVDMDGTLCEWRKAASLDEVCSVGYFSDLAPQQNVVDAVRKIVQRGEIEVFILSACFTHCPHSMAEKSEWIDRYLPEVDNLHRLFVPCGEPKAKFVPDGKITADDILLDDYSVNLFSWEEHGGTAVKVLNGVNATHGTWIGDTVMACDSPDGIERALEVLTW